MKDFSKFGRSLSRNELKMLVGGEDEAVKCTQCTTDLECDASHVCDFSSSCQLNPKVCVLASRRVA